MKQWFSNIAQGAAGLWSLRERKPMRGAQQLPTFCLEAVSGPQCREEEVALNRACHNVLLQETDWSLGILKSLNLRAKVLERRELPRKQQALGGLWWWPLKPLRMSMHIPRRKLPEAREITTTKQPNNSEFSNDQSAVKYFIIQGVSDRIFWKASLQ